MSTYLHGEDFNETVLPHEMTHLIFREFVGVETPLPLWLDEGIAVFMERSRRDERLDTIRGMAMLGMFIPLEKLTAIKADGLVMPRVFYAEAVSVIDFLLTRYGQDRFVEFCRALRDTNNWKAAMKAAYGLDTVAALNTEWVNALLQQADRRTAG